MHYYNVTLHDLSAYYEGVPICSLVTVNGSHQTAIGLKVMIRNTHIATNLA